VWLSDCYKAPGAGEVTMENDSIRASGGDTLVDVWIEGKLRGVSVSRGAIETFLGLTPDQAARMSEEDRCEFVRTHLSIVLTAAKLQLRELNSGAESISIASGQLGGVGRGRVGDRRKTERRKTERRNATGSGPPRVGDRRHSARRTRERRKPPTDRREP
jgi:hypothetical protein